MYIVASNAEARGRANEAFVHCFCTLTSYAVVAAIVWDVGFREAQNFPLSFSVF